MHKIEILGYKTGSMLKRDSTDLHGKAVNG